MIEMPYAGLFLRVGTILILAGLLVSGVYWSSAASTTKKALINPSPNGARNEVIAPVVAAGLGGVTSLGTGSYYSLFLLPQGPPTPITITTYASDCSTPKTVFNLQDPDPGKTVCAKVTGGQPSWRIIWSNANNVAVQNVPVGSGTSTFTLTSTSSVGDWRVILYEPFGGSVQKVTSFTVIDAANPKVDVSVSKGAISSSVAAGSQVVFGLQVANAGPSNATAVQLVDVVPTGTTFVSFSQLDGPVFSCNNPASAGTGTTVCTVGSLTRGDKATFLATYLVDAGVAAGDYVTNTATVSNTVPDNNSRNDSSTSLVPVTNSPCVLTCPSNIIESAATGAAGANVTFAAPSTSGNCGPSIISNPASGSFFRLGTTTVTTTTSTGGVCTFQVTVQNPGGLAISLNGADPYALECGSNFADPGATAVNGVGDRLSVDVSGLVDVHTPGSYTLTYTATEGGNSVSTTRTVNVSDSDAPVITLNGLNPITLSIGQTFTDPGASADDACEGARPVTSSGTVDSAVAGTYTVTYTSSDTLSNTATATRTVIVESDATGAPTITLDGGSPISVECGSNFIDPGATATSGGASVPVTSTGTVDSTTLGSYTITYTACIEDTPGHCDPARTATATRTVIVQDTTGPAIEILGANPLLVECHGTFTDPGAVGHDCSGNAAVTASGTVDANTVGEYEITYAATDSLGNPGDPVTRAVKVVDTTAPVVTAPANVTVDAGASCDATVSDATLGTASADDACGGSTATSRSGVPAGNVFPLGTTNITYSATDTHNNTGTATQTVTVRDVTAPTITLAGANPITVECHTSFTDPGATAHDNCSGDSAATASGSVDVNVVGPYTITYNATDAAGNNATAVTRTVNVVDTVAPTITLNGPNPMTVECHTSFTDPGATADDACSGSAAVTATNNVNVNTPGSYTITYSATDAASHTQTATRTVNVVDTIAPTTQFNNLTIFLNNLTIVFNTNSYTVNGTTHPFNGVSCTHDGYTFSFNGQTVTVTKNGYSVSYTFSGNTLVLWAPAHQYQTVNVADLLASAADSCDAGTDRSDVVISQVTSDEPDDIAGGGDGNTVNDIVIAPGCKSVQLRAERNGNGNGRVYTITMRVRDAAGNTTTVTSKLKVYANSINVVDDGPHNTVNGTCP
jgi:uncharacterized repeat protein (TIGR01451 family)